MTLFKSRVVYLILSILMMIIIFLFSSQASNDSNFLSYNITNWIFKKIESIEVSGNKNTIVNEEDEKDNSNQSIEEMFPTSNKTFHDINTVVRKSAHISLYLLLGIFILLFIRTYNIDWKKSIIITILFCFTYACLDEFNQYLRGTRTALFTDSLIDTFGRMLGCLIIGIINKIKMRRRGN